MDDRVAVGAIMAPQERVLPERVMEHERGPSATAPRVQYARTGDGVSIAFWTLGRGTPLVYLAGGPWSHVELWQIPECRSWYGRLGHNRMLVRYDMRGTGLSTRDVTDYSLEALLRDVAAVVERLGLSSFVLFGAADAAPLAVAYAARHPQRVSRLVLWCGWARGKEIGASQRITAWRSLLDRDWELMTETCAYLALGWSAGEIGRRAAERLRDSMTRDGLRAALDAALGVDSTELLGMVRAPALVVHRREISWLPVSVAQELASRLVDARLLVLEGESTAPYLGDYEQIASAIEAFLAEPDRPVGAPRELTLTASGGEQAAVGSAPDGSGLTAREVEVVRLLASGLSNNEIAEQLVLSARTVERHISNIYGKIGARGRAHATAFALTRGLV